MLSRRNGVYWGAMGNALHKLGAFAFKRPLWVIVGWVIILAILGYTAVLYMKPTSSSVSIPGTQAQKALDKMTTLFPDVGRGSGRIVFAISGNKTIDSYKQTITQATTDFGKINGVERVIDPYANPTAFSQDKKVAYTQLQLTQGNGNISESTISAVEKVVDHARASGLQVEMGGDVIRRQPSDILGPVEIGGLVLALVVLIMTLGSLVAAGMPLVTALVGVGISMAGLFSLSQVITISATTPVLGVMLGLAVGVDYALFIINRYRMYLSEGISYEAAAARAIGTAGNAVVFAATTVVIALAALTVVQIPFMTTMGLTAAASIAVAAMVAITLIPALLRLAKSYIFPRRTRQQIAAAQKRGPRENHHADRSTFWYRWGVGLTKYPLAVVVAVVVILGAVALPVRHLQLGLPTDEFASPASTERKAYDLLTRGFGAGFNGPLLVVAEGVPAVTDADRQAVREQVTQQVYQQIARAAAQAKPSGQFQSLQQANNVATTASAAKQQAAITAQIDQRVAQYAKLAELQKVADKVASATHVKSAVPTLTADNGSSGLIQIIPASGPSDQATVDLINDIRDSANRQKLTGSDAIDLSVTGTTALQSDVNAKLANVLPLYLLVVIGLSFVILVVAFRSILVPLKATLGFLLSVLAMFGALVAVFQWGWFGLSDAPGPIVSFTPIIAIGIMFGLAMDYEFFLVTSMHEAYAETKDARRSVRRGFAHASRVVLAAAFIMVSIFAGFVGNHDSTIRAIGFGLAFGIFVDAFIVRLTLVPAVMALLGKAAWWLPKWLDRILPHVSIEGEDAK